jgi:hypothetical protein
VVYELPLGRLGDLAHRLVVRAELEHLFSYRARMLASIFADPASNLSR